VTLRKTAKSELIFALNDKPPMGQTLVAALQHMAAIFIDIVTPSIVISGVLGFDPAMKAYLVSMSLLVSGVATFIQVKKFGPVGSGLLSIQGTSFTFFSLSLSDYYHRIQCERRRRNSGTDEGRHSSSFRNRF